MKGKGGNELVEKCHGLKAKMGDDLELPSSDDEGSEKRMRELIEIKERDVDFVMKNEIQSLLEVLVAFLIFFVFFVFFFVTPNTKNL